MLLKEMAMNKVESARVFLGLNRAKIYYIGIPIPGKK